MTGGIGAEIQAALARPEVAQRMLAAGMEPSPVIDPVHVGNFIQQDPERWEKLVGAVGLEKLIETAKP